MEQQIEEKSKLIAGKIAKQFDSLNINRDQKKYRGLNLKAHWRLWREQAFNPDQERWDLHALRKNGTLKTYNDSSRRIKVNVNLINEQLLDMAAKETAEPIEPDIIVDTKDGRIVMDDQPALAEGPAGQPVYEEYTADDFADLAKKYLGAETDKMGLEDARENMAYCRRVYGTHYFGLEWDPSRGDPTKYTTVKNGEKWDVVFGNYQKEQDAIVIPGTGPGSTGQRYETGQWQEEYRPEGGPELVEYYAWQVIWEGKQDSRKSANGVFIESYIRADEAKQFYAKAKIYGKEFDVDFSKIEPITVPAIDDNSTPDLRYINFPAGTEVYRRLFYRRRPQMHEERSQHFTILGNTENAITVRAQECPYPKCFDKSFGIYLFKDRHLPGHIEGIPTVAFMSTENTLYNLYKGMEYDILDKMAIGKLFGKGDPNNPPQVGIADNTSDVQVIISETDLTELRTSQPPAALAMLKNESKINLQTYSADQTLAMGSRNADLKTAYQASLQDKSNKGKIGVNLKRDAREFTVFYNDLMALLSDERFVMQPRTVEVETDEDDYTRIQKIVPTMKFLKGIGAIKIGPKSLISKDEAEISNILQLLSMLPQPQPGFPDPNAQTRADLVRRLFEIMDITGVQKPKPEILEQTGVMPPGMPGGMMPGMTQ